MRVLRNWLVRLVSLALCACVVLVSCQDRWQAPEGNSGQTCEIQVYPKLNSDLRWQSSGGQRFVHACLRVVWSEAREIETVRVIVKADGVVLNRETFASDPNADVPLSLPFATKDRFPGAAPLMELLVFGRQGDTGGHGDICQGAMKRLDYDCIKAPASDCWFGWRKRMHTNDNDCRLLYRGGEIAFVPSEVPSVDAAADRGPDRPCLTTCPVPPALSTRCVGAAIQQCVTDIAGCARWTQPITCPSGGACQGGRCSSCAPGCQEGDTSCDRDGVKRCTTGPFGCLAMSTSQACPSRQLCVGKRCETVAPAACEKSEDCLGGYICLHRRCLAFCSNHDQCRKGYACIKRACSLLPQGQCLSDPNCPGSYRCDTSKKPPLCLTVCDTNRDCASRHQCEASQCSPITTTTCTTNGDCGGGFTCSNGKCLLYCNIDAQCQPTYRCDRSRRQCYQLPTGTCYSDHNCPGLFRCDTTPGQPGRCLTSCQTNGDCLLGYECISKKCSKVAANQMCIANGDCGGGFTCNNGKCLSYCNIDAQCQPTYRCDRSRRQCYQLPTGKCFTDHNCPGLFRCDAKPNEAGNCLTSCQTNGDCLLGYECISKKCSKVAANQMCTANGDCGGGFTCSNGKCLLYCNIDAQCQPTYRCDRSRRQCYQLPTGKCFTDHNCPGLFRCDTTPGQLGSCLTSCQTNGDCLLGYECISKKCSKVAANQMCIANGDCGGGFTCSNGKCLLYCNIDAQCQPTYRCDRSRRQCYQLPAGTCYSDHNCPGLFRCDAKPNQPGRCLTSCVKNTDCLLGYGCVGGLCEYANVDKCSVNSDCKAGFACSSGRCLRACSTTRQCQGGFVCNVARRQCE